MKGRWEKVWNMGNILWNYSTWPMYGGENEALK